MKKIFVLMFVALVGVGTSWAQVQQPRSIEVNGYYEEEFTPDRIYIGFTLKENAKDKISVVEQQNQMIKACRKPEMFNYYAPNTITIYYKFTQNPRELIGDLLNKRCDLVVFDMLGYSSTSLYLYPAIKAYPSVFKPIAHYKQPDTYIFMFNRDEAAKILKDNAESAE